MNTEEKFEHPNGRFWGSGLVTLGLVLFAVVSLLAFAMIRDPGGWVPTCRSDPIVEVAALTHPIEVERISDDEGRDVPSPV